VVAGTRTEAERLREQAAAVLAPIRLRLSSEKTIISHIDEGLDLLSRCITRHKKRGSAKRFVYRSRASLASVKVRSATTRRTANTSLDLLIHQLNPLLRGWTSYHRDGASAKTFSYPLSGTAAFADARHVPAVCPNPNSSAPKGAIVEMRRSNPSTNNARTRAATRR